MNKLKLRPIGWLATGVIFLAVHVKAAAAPSLFRSGEMSMLWSVGYNAGQGVGFAVSTEWFATRFFGLREEFGIRSFTQPSALFFDSATTGLACRYPFILRPTSARPVGLAPFAEVLLSHDLTSRRYHRETGCGLELRSSAAVGLLLEARESRGFRVQDFQWRIGLRRNF